MLSPSLAEAGPVLATARSAGGPTIDPLTVAELLAVLESLVLLLTEAVSERSAPVLRLAGAETIRLGVCELREASAALGVAVTLPPACAQVKPSVPAV